MRKILFVLLALAALVAFELAFAKPSFALALPLACAALPDLALTAALDA